MKLYINSAIGVYSYSSFTDLLKTHGIEVVDNAAAADWAFCGQEARLPELYGKVPAVLACTQEPRHLSSVERHSLISGTHVFKIDMNLGLFPDFWEWGITCGVLPMILQPNYDTRRLACLIATNHAGITYALGDLVPQRYTLARQGAEEGWLDIYGRKWGSVPVVDESRSGSISKNVWEMKHQILAGYRFNVALENTYIPDYITEKFWQPIRSGTIPIYLGSSWLDDLINRDLYVDLRNFTGVDELRQAIGSMTEDEYTQRIQGLQERTAELQASDAVRHSQHSYRWMMMAVESLRKFDDVVSMESSAWANNRFTV